jgi:dTDP-glucose 4,6-dehydratase
MDGGKLRDLGWQPRVRFDEGIRATVAWYVANEPWWRAARDGEWASYYAQQYGWRLEQSVEA